ncbi:hypothetical protein S7711_08910 [Stachybotrys chartarum IBT 7711]|uniref:Mannan endo-1,4-beta-mannosidase A n=1 Tax=Stachybotrys chartarum (strain CBS 109288 / IBT 7711) TaxID=1280523 RepID=A0A084B1V1_STACB|nr:hypothetical protein S7711_08910 [Stachybotrys chartarum IBT 7711]
MKYFAATVFLSASTALAQVSAELWAQCGGIGYNGPTVCVANSYCLQADEWYSQCVPGAAVSTPATTSGFHTSLASPTPLASSLPDTEDPNTESTGSDSFASINGLDFVLAGADKYVAGTNSYWISFLTNNDDVDKALDTLVASGLKILRVWGFNDVNDTPGSGTVYFQQLSSSGSTINTGANGLQRLDYVVSAAEARGIKLIIPFVNYWDDYGGMSAYVAAFGGSKTTWYTNQAAQAQYKQYIKAVVSRYAESTAIFAWELANEPRCQGCDTSVIYDWAMDVSAYIKSLDSRHLVTLGDEGFGLEGDGSYPFQYTEGLDFAKNLGISTLDFATFHMYPSHWDQNDDWGNFWIKAHGAACVTAQKPCLLEEYGSETNNCQNEAPWQKTALETDGIAADLFWQLGVTLSTGKSADDGFTIYDDTADWICLVDDHMAQIN